MRQPKVESKAQSKLNDTGLCEVNEWRVDLQMCAAFNARFSGEIGHRFERLYELGAAIRIARIVDRIHADDHV